VSIWIFWKLLKLVAYYIDQNVSKPKFLKLAQSFEFAYFFIKLQSEMVTLQAVILLVSRGKFPGQGHIYGRKLLNDLNPINTASWAG
jgi:hypothetical protein